MLYSLGYPLKEERGKFLASEEVFGVVLMEGPLRPLYGFPTTRPVSSGSDIPWIQLLEGWEVGG